MTFGLQSYFAMTSHKALELSVPQFPFLRWVEGDCGEQGDIMPIKHGAQCLGLGHGKKIKCSCGSWPGLLSWELAYSFPESCLATNLLEQSRGHTGAVRRQPHSPMRDGWVSTEPQFPHPRNGMITTAFICSFTHAFIHPAVSASLCQALRCSNEPETTGLCGVYTLKGQPCNKQANTEWVYRFMISLLRELK